MSGAWVRSPKISVKSFGRASGTPEARQIMWVQMPLAHDTTSANGGLFGHSNIVLPTYVKEIAMTVTEVERPELRSVIRGDIRAGKQRQFLRKDNMRQYT